VSYQQFLLFLAKINAGKMSNITPNDEKTKEVPQLRNSVDTDQPIVGDLNSRNQLIW